MARIQIWGGGPYHPTREQAASLEKIFKGMGHTTRYREDRDAFSEEVLGETDLLILSGMDESKVCVEAEWKYWETPRTEAFVYQPLADARFQAFKNYLGRGKPLLIHHSGLLSFDERRELDEIYDGRWVRGESFHPPFQKFKVEIGKDHPVLQGLSEFEIEDELYCKLLPPKRSQVLLSAVWEGVTQPLAWAGSYGSSKILFSGLGHDMRSYACPKLQRFIKNGVKWLLGKPD